MLKRLCLVAGLVLAAFVSGLSRADEDTLNTPSIQAQLASFQLPDGRGQFTQAKYFKLLKQPIRSAGEYQLDSQEQKKMIWQVNKPLFNRLIFTEQRIYQQTEPQAEPELLTEESSFSRLLYVIFSGQLSGYSGLNWQQEASSHCLLASVTDKRLSQFVSQIQLCHNELQDPSVVTEGRRITLWDPSQTKTVIRLIPDKLGL